MPKRQAPDNTYWRGETLWARFTVAGREYRTSLRTGDIATAKRRVSEMIAATKSEAFFGDQPRPWEAVVMEWADYISREVAPRTAARYATSLEQARPWFAGKEISSINRTDCDAYATARRNAGVSNATIRRDLTAVSSVLEFARAKDWREGNPARDIAARLSERRDPIMLPQEASYQRVLSAARPEYRALIEAARHTGARLDELRNAKRSDLTGATLYLGKTKGSKPRAIDLSPEAIAAIARAPTALGCKNLFTLGGKPFGDVSAGFRRIVAKAQKTAHREGVEFHRFRFHDLRHLYAVEYLRSGGSLYDLQQQLGHSSIVMTEQYLKFLTPDEVKKAKGLQKGD